MKQKPKNFLNKTSSALLKSNLYLRAKLPFLLKKLFALSLTTILFVSFSIFSLATSKAEDKADSKTISSNIPPSNISTKLSSKDESKTSSDKTNNINSTLTSKREEREEFSVETVLPSLTDSSLQAQSLGEANKEDLLQISLFNFLAEVEDASVASFTLKDLDDTTSSIYQTSYKEKITEPLTMNEASVLRLKENFNSLIIINRVSPEQAFEFCNYASRIYKFAQNYLTDPSPESERRLFTYFNKAEQSNYRFLTRKLREGIFVRTLKHQHYLKLYQETPAIRRPIVLAGDSRLYQKNNSRNNKIVHRLKEGNLLLDLSNFNFSLDVYSGAFQFAKIDIIEHEEYCKVVLYPFFLMRF